MKQKRLGVFHNSDSDKSQNNEVLFTVEKNAFIDEGDGVVRFKNGLVITDDSEQRNGTKYDIKTMDISEYKGMLTANHSSRIEDIIGKVNGIRKIANRRVVIDAIQFAIKENALARFAYNLLVGEFATDFSIETFGPWPDEEGVYHDSKLVGLSLVVVGNNRSATINELALNSVKESKELGLDTSDLENRFLQSTEKSSTNKNNTKKEEKDNMFVTVKNNRSFAVTLKYKNAEGEDVETEVKPGGSVDVSSDQEAGVKAQVDEAKEPVKEEKKETETAESLAKAVEKAIAPMMTKVNDLEVALFDKGAKEPAFVKSTQSLKAEFAKADYKTIHAQQIQKAWAMLKDHDASAQHDLMKLNQINLERLQEAGKVSNSITIADMGNFVISPELLTDIEGFRSNFAPLISKLNYVETLSLQMAWLKRSGDISMSEVEMCDDGADGNLKPISEYAAEYQVSNLKELAAVTPVCDAATRFLAVDLLGDVAQGYRTDYDRKRSQLFIARLQQAVDSTGNTATYATTSDVNALKSFVELAAQMQENVMGGTYILSQKSYWELVRRELGAGINTEIGFKIFTNGDAGPLLLGSPYIVVPNELLPTLNTAETRAFVVEGVTVTINQAVFYVDLATFAGRTSGGLKYDFSTDASYEVGSDVRSAFQRNELVLRGSFFRGGAIKDEDKVTGLGSRGVS